MESSVEIYPVVLEKRVKIRKVNDSDDDRQRTDFDQNSSLKLKALSSGEP